MRVCRIFFSPNNNYYIRPEHAPEGIKTSRSYCSSNDSFDKVTFSAKIPSITEPTLADIINKVSPEDVLRHNILNLAKYKIPCPVCGHVMLDLDSFEFFTKKVMTTSHSGRLLRHIKEFEQYLHPVESKIYEMLKINYKNNPNKTFLEVLKDNLPSAENKLIREQVRIFTDIGIFSRELPDKKRILTQNLINEAFSRIMDISQTSKFSRRVFIDKLKNIYNFEMVLNDDISVLPNFIENEIKIIETATKLPTAYNNINAFIVKYAKRDYNGANPNQKIAIRLLSNSIATVEHITAKKNNGLTNPANLALECACDNNRKGHANLISQITENPQMKKNYKKYIKRLCELHNENKVEKMYIKQQNKTFVTSSGGQLNADEELMKLRIDGRQTHKNNNTIILNNNETEIEKPIPKKKNNKKNKNNFCTRTKHLGSTSK